MRLRDLLLCVALGVLGALYPILLWWAVFFGGPSPASLRGEIYRSTTLLVSTPTILGDIILLLLPIGARTKVRLIASFSLPVVGISLYYFVYIYLA